MTLGEQRGGDGREWGLFCFSKSKVNECHLHLVLDHWVVVSQSMTCLQKQVQVLYGKLNNAKHVVSLREAMQINYIMAEVICSFAQRLDVFV